jgi:DNA-binding response OmpR family regulator
MAELKKILHVEDDPDILEIARLALEMVGGLQVTQFSDGNLAIAESHSSQYDLILLDQMMPSINGKDTLAGLRKIPHFATTPAVFMTAQSTDATKQLIVDTDAVAVVAKPFDPMTLADQLREIWKTETDR